MSASGVDADLQESGVEASAACRDAHVIAHGATRRDAAVLVARRFAVPPNRVKRLVAR